MTHHLYLVRLLHGKVLILRFGLAAALLCFLALTAASMVSAQGGYPRREGKYVNDFARLLTPEDAHYIDVTLQGLLQKTGSEAVVVTIDSFRNLDTGGESIESFATNLFNAWGLGDPNRNDGVMILVTKEDHLVRIEVGAGYDESYDARMWSVINEHLLYEFRNERYSQGLVAGVRALTHELTGQWPPRPESLTAESVEPDYVMPGFNARNPMSNPSGILSMRSANDQLALFVVLGALGMGLAAVIRAAFGSSQSGINLEAEQRGSISMWDADDWDHSSPGSSFDSSSSSSISSSRDTGDSSSPGGRSSGGGATGSW